MNPRRIYEDLTSRKSFSKNYMEDMLEQIVEAYEREHFYISAPASLVLYEKIFYEILLTKWFKDETSERTDLTGSEAVQLFMNLEKKIVDGDEDSKKLFFKGVTKELVKAEIIRPDEKEIFDKFYDKYRIPVLHGFNKRLTKNVMGYRNDQPVLFGEAESRLPNLQKNVTEETLIQIHNICRIEGIWDRLIP